MAINLAASFSLGTGVPIDTRLSVTTRADRNAITQRYEGLTVYVEDDTITYQLQGGITDINWVDVHSANNIDGGTWS